MAIGRGSEKISGAIKELQEVTKAIAQNTSALTDTTRNLSSATASLSISAQSLARIEAEPKLELVERKKDLGLGGIEFDLINNGKGSAHSVKITPTSAKGAKLGVSFLGVQRNDINVGEARKYLLTSVKQGDLISLYVEFKDSLGGSCLPKTFTVDTS
ncbi:MAG: hypothetical protein JRN20_17720 [Nitrososphaerota archaeon]|nr:hypothetical protein [Nitrososphaerota archaeon]